MKTQVDSATLRTTIAELRALAAEYPDLPFLVLRRPESSGFSAVPQYRRVGEILASGVLAGAFGRTAAAEIAQQTASDARLGSYQSVALCFITWLADGGYDVLGERDNPIKAVADALEMVAGAVKKLSKEQEEKLGEILQVMLDLLALDRDRRTTAAKIGDKLDDDGESLKKLIAEGTRQGWIETKEGKHGGCWLTPAGKAKAEAL